VTPCQLVNNYRRFERSITAHALHCSSDYTDRSAVMPTYQTMEFSISRNNAFRGAETYKCSRYYIELSVGLSCSIYSCYIIFGFH
jgi:hypothetical protein